MVGPVRNTRRRSTLSEIQSPQGLITRGRRRSMEEQIRKDEELARRLASGENEVLAEQTLSPEEIAAILGSDYQDPRHRPAIVVNSPAAPVNDRFVNHRRRHQPPAADLASLGHAYRGPRVQRINVHQLDDNDTRTEIQIDSDDDDSEIVRVSSGEESDDSENGSASNDSRDDGNNTYDDDDDLDESVRDVYQGELELLDDDLPTTSRNRRRSNDENPSAVKHRSNALRTDKYGHCTICFEDLPHDPMSCIHCKQLVGCNGCVQQWWNTGVEAKKRGPQSLADGPPPNNYFQCPLCRHTWKKKPQVVSSAKS